MALTVLDDGTEAACHLAQQLKLPLQKHPDDYHLICEKGRWCVRDQRQGAGFRLDLNLGDILRDHQRQQINPKKDLLCRALGYRGQAVFRVLDGTLGLGKDAMHLLACGVEVVGVERHPVLFFLLQQSVQSDLPSTSTLPVLFGDVSSHLREWGTRVEALYLDPMFENIKQKSAPKKGLAFLRSLTVCDTDVTEVGVRALQFGVKRVVVKRPLKGDHLAGKPNIVFKGKLVRYDVYTR
jgi:16S rRNA (guanine1516-N2)-methyltransferase